MDLYSVTLALALAAAGVAALATGSAWLAANRRREHEAEARRRLARAAAMGSLALVAFSVAYHLWAGHRPGTPDGMTAVEFVLEHPAFLLVAAIAGAVLWRQRPNRPSTPGE